MGIRYSKAADHVQFAANTVNPVGSCEGNSSTGGSSGGGGRVPDDHNMESSSTPPPTTTGGGATNGSSAEPNTTRNLKIFTYAELRSATRNFRPDTVLGEGGFGRVFRGWLDNKTYAPSRAGVVGIPIAVKKSREYSEQALKEWQKEIEILGKLSHPNLINLLGYCWEDTELLLVYEYMQKGSLETHFFRQVADTLPWEIRLKIAIDAARGLAFLHNTEQQVMYRDFKASSILLDGDYNAKLSDFGLAKSGPLNGDSHGTTLVCGTYGYAAPEYMATGHLYVKSDVYGFGVVLLELLTGKRVFDLNRPSGKHNLMDWCKPMLADKKKLQNLMDPRLEGQYPSIGAFQMAELILKCLEIDQQNRPSMEEVLLSLELIETFKTKPKEFQPVQRHAATYCCGIIKSTFLRCVRPHTQSG